MKTNCQPRPSKKPRSNICVAAVKKSELNGFFCQWQCFSSRPYLKINKVSEVLQPCPASVCLSNWERSRTETVLGNLTSSAPADVTSGQDG